jgi:hypothetical protein
LLSEITGRRKWGRKVRAQSRRATLRKLVIEARAADNAFLHELSTALLPASDPRC